MAYFWMTLAFMLISFIYLNTVSHVASHVGAAFRESGRMKSIARMVCGVLFIGVGIKVAIGVN